MNILFPILASARRRAAVITGTAYPGETLTSTSVGQWYADNVPVSGEVGSTYVVRLDDIGRSIRQALSNILVVWKPGDIAGVVAFWTPYRGVYTSTGPDVAAADGQTVTKWTDIINGYTLVEPTAVNQPLFRATGQSGKPSIQFDGSNDRFYLDQVASRNLLSGKTNCYLMAGARELNPNGGEGEHVIWHWPYPSYDAGNSRLLMPMTRRGNQFSMLANPGLGSIAVDGGANNSSYHVIGSHGDFANGYARLRIDGSVAGSGWVGVGSSPSGVVNWVLFAENAYGGSFNGHITCPYIINASISATDVSKLERYVGLFGSLNIPLV
jgi:type V secretory pathway adhesin AidA